MGVPQHGLVGAHPQHHRARVVPVPVQVQHARRVPPQRLLHPGAVPPRHRRQPGGLLEQAVVVGRGQRGAQPGQGVEHLARARSSSAPTVSPSHRRYSPPAGAPSFELDLLGHGQELVQVARLQGGVLAGRPRRRGEAELDAPPDPVPEQAGPGGGGGVAARADGHARADDDEHLAPGDRPRRSPRSRSATARPGASVTAVRPAS